MVLGGRDLFVANAGDSRVVLATAAGMTCTSLLPYLLLFIPLT
jgi:serine/threonine protein phosphatase PrpC